MGTYPVLAQSSSTRVNDPITQFKPPPDEKNPDGTTPTASRASRQVECHLNTIVCFKPPPDEKKPDGTTGTGSRGECNLDATPEFKTKPSLMALVPNSQQGLTLAERPTFYIAVPKTSAKTIVLSIRENGQQFHSQTVIPIQNSPGILEIKLPQSAPPLEIGKNYQWAVVLVCGEKPRPDDPAIVSWVQRVELPQPIPAQLKQESALTQAVWYGEQGLWYDTLSALVAAKRSQPESQVIEEIWTNFLDSVGLQSVASTPLPF